MYQDPETHRHTIEKKNEPAQKVLVVTSIALYWLVARSYSAKEKGRER